jgi:hypothetical protein
VTRACLVPAALTALTLAFAWAVWTEAPRLVATLGLQRYDLLVRVLLLFAALSLAERFVSRLFPGPQGQAQDPLR